MIAGRKVSIYELINGNGRWYWDRRYQTEAEQEQCQPPVPEDLLLAIDERLAQRTVESEKRMSEDNTVEITLAVYGQMLEGIQMSRETAQEYGKTMVGRSVFYPDNVHTRIEGRMFRPCFRILKTRLEDDNPGDPTKGRVVAICQPIPGRQMEVK